MIGADDGLDTPIARHIWETRHRMSAAEASGRGAWRRIARAVAQVETAGRPAWERRFLDILRDFLFLPGGRIQPGVGTERDVTLFNCFVMRTIEA